MGTHLGVAIYDDGIQRPSIASRHALPDNTSAPGVNEGQLSADGNYLYGEEGEILGVR